MLLTRVCAPVQVHVDADWQIGRHSLSPQYFPIPALTTCYCAVAASDSHVSTNVLPRAGVKHANASRAVANRPPKDICADRPGVCANRLIGPVPCTEIVECLVGTEFNRWNWVAAIVEWPCAHSS